MGAGASSEASPAAPGGWSSTLGTSQFTDAEAALLAGFASAAPWAFDAPQWLDLLSLKHRLTDLEAPALRAALGATCAAAARNGAASHNVATLAAHVAARLESSWHFVRAAQDWRPAAARPRSLARTLAR